MRHLADLGVATQIWPMSVEIPGGTRLDTDTIHTAYDADRAHRYWRALVAMTSVFERFQSRFVGKASPVHLFWGAMDLATTRFSGRTAPPHPGGAPNCGPHVMLEAYSHEVSSLGYWPGGGAEGLFYSYAYPRPDGYHETTVCPSGASWDEGLGEFILPYESVRSSADPAGMLLRIRAKHLRRGRRHRGLGQAEPRAMTGYRLFGRRAGVGVNSRRRQVARTISAPETPPTSSSTITITSPIPGKYPNRSVAQTEQQCRRRRLRSGHDGHARSTTVPSVYARRLWATGHDGGPAELG